MNATPTTRKVQLKRAGSLKRGEIIDPSRGLFTRQGKRLSDVMPAILSGPWTVSEDAELDSSGLWVIALNRGGVDGISTLLWTPADAWVVLA